MIKNGLVNGTVVVMWERVEKADLYRVGITPSENIIGTGKYSINETEARLYGLDPVKSYKIHVIAENTEFGLVSKKTYSSALSLNPLATVNSVGTRGGPNVQLKGGDNTEQPTLFGEIIIKYKYLYTSGLTNWAGLGRAVFCQYSAMISRIFRHFFERTMLNLK